MFSNSHHLQQGSIKQTEKELEEIRIEFQNYKIRAHAALQKQPAPHQERALLDAQAQIARLEHVVM
jgi:hypothetical protein